MDLKYLRYFVAVAEELHFTRAAAKLHMSQPPLSQIINRLEASLGFKLFERTKRKVTLTKAGEILLREGQAILARATSAVDYAERASRGESGHLKVAFIPWADFTAIFSDIVRTFGEKRPNVVVDFHSMLAPAAIAALGDGRIDIAFLSVPSPPKRMGSLASELVLTESMVVALPEKHPLARKQVVTLKSLAAEPQIVVAHDRIGQRLVELLWERAGFAVQARHTIDHPQTTLALVAAGVGVSLVPASYENARKLGVVYRPIRPSLNVHLIAAWRSDDKSAVLGAFLDVLRDVARPGKPKRSRKKPAAH